MAEQYTALELSQNVVEQIIAEYIRGGLTTADTGTPDGLDATTWSAAIYRIRHLHLAEPWLPGMKILDALRLAGWSEPEAR